MAANEPTGIYITPEQYEIGAKNGIHALNVYQRVYKYAWSIERAITTPLRHVNQAGEEWLQWKDTALANGINASTFRKRIYRGLSGKEAATTELKKRYLIPEEVYLAGEALGVTRKNVYQRIAVCGWSYEKASTTPPLPQGGPREGRRKNKRKGGWK